MRHRINGHYCDSLTLSWRDLLCLVRGQCLRASGGLYVRREGGEMPPHGSLSRDDWNEILREEAS